MENWIRFNVNHDIKVKLTEGGYQLMADEHNRVLSTVPGFGKRDWTYYRDLADKDGYTRFQMWRFAELFGPSSYIGGPLLYETNILIKTESK